MTIDFLDKQKLPDTKGLTYDRIFTNPNYLRLWTFLHAHGERFIFNPSLDARLEPKEQHGRCISQAPLDVQYGNEYVQEHDLADEYGEFHYAEGLSSVCFLSLHAWGVLYGRRHAYVWDRTWPVERERAKNVWYQGVTFDHELWLDVRRRQHCEAYRNTLPYLQSGCCCLTYRPLLDGELDGFRIRDSDREAALASLEDFAWAVHDYEVQEARPRN